jgi:hypothetical protein
MAPAHRRHTLKAMGLQGNGTCVDDGTDASTSAKEMINASI